MIKYTLRCERAHEFESWFQSSAAFDRQAKRGLVACPHCDSTKVEKAIMAPRIARGRRKGAEAPEAIAPETPEAAPVAMMPPEAVELRRKLKELRDHLVRNADNVGDRFAEEARKIHYGESDPRAIYGEATPDDAQALAEEGVEFYPLPVAPDDRN